MPAWLDHLQSIGIGLLISMAVSGLYLLRHRNQPTTRWRNVDLFIVVIGGLSLVSIAINASVVIDQRENRMRLTLAYRDARSDLDLVKINAMSMHRYICRPGEWSPNSPPNFDEIEAERGPFCDWTLRFRDIVMGSDLDRLPLITLEMLGPPPDVKWRFFQQERDGILLSIERHQNSREAWRAANNQPSLSPIVEQIRFIIATSAPYALSFVFALSFFKVLYQKRD